MNDSKNSKSNEIFKKPIDFANMIFKKAQMEQRTKEKFIIAF